MAPNVQYMAHVHCLLSGSTRSFQHWLPIHQERAIGLARRYSELVSQHMPARQVVLYGSYAKGTAKPDSDIDIAVIVDKLQGDCLDEQAKLYKLRRLVDLRIEPVLIEYGHDRSGFLKEIMGTGQVLYPTAVQQ